MCHWTSIRGQLENFLHEEEEDMGELSKTVRSASTTSCQKGGVSLAQAVRNSGVVSTANSGVCLYHKQWGVSLP